MWFGLQKLVASIAGRVDLSGEKVKPMILKLEDADRTVSGRMTNAVRWEYIIIDQ